jgi:hypothetical protein
MICLVFLLTTAGCGTSIMDAVPAGEGSSGAKVFSVISYGAKGDGLADDGVAIQRAMAAAATAGGGQVTLPCGEFAVKAFEGAAPANRSLIYLKGASGVQVVGNGSCTHVFTTVPYATVFEMENSTNVSFAQMRVTAVNATNVPQTFGNAGGAAIRYGGVTNSSISNVEVDGAAIGALYLTEGSSHVTVANNYVHDTYGGGIWEDDCSGRSSTTCAPSVPPTYNTYESNVLTNTSLASTTAMTLDDGSNSSYAVVQDNTFSWTKPTLPGFSEVFCIQISNASDVSILNNTCTNAPWDGFLITAGNNGTKSQRDTIQGNTITGAGTSGKGGSGICVYDTSTGDGASGFVIKQNTISNSATDGITIISAGTVGGAHDGQVLNNTISLADQRAPGSSFGVDVQNSKAIAVDGNMISCNGSCIAAGVLMKSSSMAGVAPVSNVVSKILGPALLVQ